MNQPQSTDANSLPTFADSTAADSTAAAPQVQLLPRCLVLSLLLTAFALATHALTQQDIWWDEARNIDVALRPITAIATAPELDIHPPLYFWLLHLWGRVAGVAMGEPPTTIAYLTRFFSVVAGVVTVALLYPLGQRLHSPSAGLFAVLIGATSPFWLAESQETRMYTLSFALLAAAAWAWLGLIPGTVPATDRNSRGTTRRYVPFLLLSTAALYTHYNALFILVAWYGWWGSTALLAPDRWRRLRAPLFCGLATLLLLLPIVPIALRQIPTYANPNLTIPTLGDYLWQNWEAYVGGYAFAVVTVAGFGDFWLWGLLGVAVVGSMLTVQRSAWRNPSQRTTRLFLPMWLLGGLALYYIAVLDRGAFNVRYSSFVTPPLYLLLGMSLANWARLWRPLAAILVALLLLGVVPAIQADLYDSRHAREDVADLTAWLRDVAGPNDLVLVDQKYPFGFYYGRYAIDAAQTPTGPEAAPARYLFVDVNTLDALLTEWAGAVERIFWVQWFESDTDPRHAVRFLLDSHGERGGERHFHGYEVDWWNLDPPVTFQLPANWLARTLRFAESVQTAELAFVAEAIAGEKIPLAIRWQRVPGGSVAQPLKARLALYDAAGNRLSQADERLLNDRHRLPAEWAADEQPLNLYLLTAPADLAAGTYELRLLVYDANTLAPLPLLDDAGQPAGVEAVVGQIFIGQRGLDE